MWIFVQIKGELFVNLEGAVHSHWHPKANAASKELRLRAQQQDCFPCPLIHCEKSVFLDCLCQAVETLCMVQHELMIYEAS